jgi:hypothetical protein
MPEPILVSIAAALAGKAATSLYELVKRKFAGRADAAETLTEAEGAGPESDEVAALAQTLADAERDDPEFAAALRAEWAGYASQSAERGAIANQVGGSVTGKVVQARDIEGGVSL